MSTSIRILFLCVVVVVVTSITHAQVTKTSNLRSRLLAGKKEALSDIQEALDRVDQLLAEAEKESAALESDKAESQTEPAEALTEPAEALTEPAESQTEPAESQTEPAESQTEPAEAIITEEAAKTVEEAEKDLAQLEAEIAQVEASLQAAEASTGSDVQESVTEDGKIECTSLCKVSSVFTCAYGGSVFALEGVSPSLSEALDHRVECCVSDIIVSDSTVTNSTIILSATSTLVFSPNSEDDFSLCGTQVEGCDFIVPAGYNYTGNVVALSSGYEVMEGGFDVLDMKETCDDDSECVAFTTSGAFLNATQTATEPYDDNCTGIFTKL